MTKCPWCKNYKRGDNCIRCYRTIRELYKKLMEDLKFISTRTAYYRVQEELVLRLNREPDIHDLDIGS